MTSSQQQRALGTITEPGAWPSVKASGSSFRFGKLRIEGLGFRVEGLLAWPLNFGSVDGTVVGWSGILLSPMKPQTSGSGARFRVPV